MTTRIQIPDFGLANPFYTGASISFFTVDVNGNKTAVLATLYDSQTGAGTLANPQTLDSSGKFKQATFVQDSVIATASGVPGVPAQDTGIIFPGATWRGNWAIGQIYYPEDFIIAGAAADNSGDLVVATTPHTSGAYAADLAAGKLSRVLQISSIAAMLNLPSFVIGDATKMVRINAGGTAYELRAPADVRTDLSVYSQAQVNAADALAIPKSLVTTKGDLIIATGNATPDRQPVGANGTFPVADSSQTHGIGWFPLLRSYLAGGTLSYDSTTVLDVAAAMAMSDDQTTLMSLLAITGSTAGTWVVGNGNNKLDAGSIAATTWYHVFVIKRPDTGVVDILFSLSMSAPALPTNYTKQRYIGSFLTDGAKHIIKFSQNGDYVYWDADVADVSQATADTDAHLVTLTVPPSTIALMNVYLLNAAANNSVRISNPAVSDVACSVINNTASIVTQVAAQAIIQPMQCQVNSSSQVRYRADSGTSTLQISTRGYINRRGRDA